MSFISVVVCDNFLTVMADSRAVELYSDGKIHRILDEDFNKIKQLNDNVFVVSSGWVEGAQDFINKSNLCESILEDGKLKEDTKLKRWFESVSKYITDEHLFTIHFGGLTKNNKLKSYFIRSEEKELVELEYEENGISYKLSNISTLEPEFITNKFIELCKKCKVTADSMIKIQGTLNDIVADNNDSVNKNKKTFIIKL